MGIQRDGKRLRGKRLVTLEETELKCVEAAGGGRGEDGGWSCSDSEICFAGSDSAPQGEQRAQRPGEGEGVLLL